MQLHEIIRRLAAQAPYGTWGLVVVDGTDVWAVAADWADPRVPVLVYPPLETPSDRAEGRWEPSRFSVGDYHGRMRAALADHIEMTFRLSGKLELPEALRVADALADRAAEFRAANN